MLRFLVPLILLTLAVAPAGAEPQGRCDSDGQPALGIVEIPTPFAQFYVDDRNYVLGNGIWVYQETNGVYDDVNGHLQRGGGGNFMGAPDDAEICTDVGDWDPDRLLF